MSRKQNEFINSLKPASEFAKNYGVKSIVYGPAGSGKTPIINTCPNPVLLACEPGLLSMRGSKVPTWEAYSADKVDEFFDWFFKSNETKKFDTLAIDSISQMAELYLQKALKEVKHGLQAYGTMATQTLAQLNALYFTKEKHTYLIAKQEIITDGFAYKRPYFPGKQLPIEMPHKFDEILHLIYKIFLVMVSTKLFDAILLLMCLLVIEQENYLNTSLHTSAI